MAEPSVPAHASPREVPPGQAVDVPIDPDAGDLIAPPGRGPARSRWARWRRPGPRRRRRRGKLAFRLSAAWLILIIVLALTADLLPLRAFDELGTDYRRAPGFRFDEPLGTDALGRSQLSRIIFGLRVSVMVALGSVAIAMGLGLVLGVIAGYLRGWMERAFDLLTDTLLAFPPLLFLLALSAALQPGFRTLLVSLTLLAFPTLARVARANTLTFAAREFVLAAKSMGARPGRIIFRELVPNVALPCMSVSFLAVAGLIVAEGSLSFLGRGIPPPTPSLGGMIASGRESLRTDAHLVFVPGAVLLVTVYALNTVGERARAKVGMRNPDF